MDPIDRLISAIAFPQNGNITREQLLELGLSSNAIDKRIRKGLLHRVFPGVYHVGTPAITPLQRAAAAVLACGRHAVLSHSSAMTHWGFWRRWDRPFEVTLTRGNRQPKGIRVHRSKLLGEDDITEHHAIPVTKPAVTIFDMAPRLGEALARTVNNAQHTIYLTRGHLAEQLQRTPTHPATHLILPFVNTKDGPTRSDWERAFPAFCLQWNLPKPIMAYKISPHRTVDAFWPNERFIIELDSIAYHLNDFAFVDDRGRDKDHLTLRLPTIRIVWEEMHEKPREEAERLHRILAAWR